MGKLSAFLHPAVINEEKEVMISKRFLDENGDPVPFKIKALSQEENEKITKQSTKPVKTKGGIIEKLDSVEFGRRLVVAGTVEPNFSSEEMCKAYGVLDPLSVPGKMLLSGEFSRLLREISDLSGFSSEDIEEEAKN